jgi:tight adherence protein C
MRRLAVFCLGVIVAGLAGGLASLAVSEFLRLMVQRRIGRRSTGPDMMDVASRLLVAVGGGLPLIPALQRAGGTHPEIRAVLRRWRRLGAAAALASASGSPGALLRRLSEAVSSGAAPGPAIRGFIDSERVRRQAERMDRARRLPVRLMIPMTLLVLPGFVLMVYGPAFIGMVVDLVGPLSS